MTTVAEPIVRDITIYCGTDQEWLFRRKLETDGLIIPSEARAQIRGNFGGKLWFEMPVSIDANEGWLSVTIPHAETSKPEWSTRIQGVWDLEVVVDNIRMRWVMGTVTVSQEVTKDA